MKMIKKKRKLYKKICLRKVGETAFLNKNYNENY